MHIKYCTVEQILTFPLFICIYHPIIFTVELFNDIKSILWPLCHIYLYARCVYDTVDSLDNSKA